MIMAVVIVVLGLEERRLEVEDAVEVEGVAVEHRVERHGAALRPVQLGVGIDGADARLDLAEFGRAHEIGLVEHDHVGEGDLVLGLRARRRGGRSAILASATVTTASRPRLLLHVVVDEEGLRHGRGIGEAGRLDDDRSRTCPCASSGRRGCGSGRRAPCSRCSRCSSRRLPRRPRTTSSLSMPISPNSLTITAYAFAVLAGEDAVEQRGLAGAEIAGEHRHRESCSREARSRSSHILRASPAARGPVPKGGSDIGLYPRSGKGSPRPLRSPARSRRNRPVTRLVPRQLLRSTARDCRLHRVGSNG